MKISIITISYNVKDVIENTIKSVLSEKDENLEYIIIDGGSNDGTVDVINNYADQIDIIVSEKDDGIADAFNKGIRLATGEVIGLINAGDKLCEGVNKLFQNSQLAPYDVYYGNHWVVDPENDRVYHVKAKDISFMEYALPFSHQACFISKQAYEKYGLYEKEYRICMDYALIRKMHYEGASFCYLDYDMAYFSCDGVSYYKPFKMLKENMGIATKYGLPKSKAFVFKFKYITRYYRKRILETLGIYRFLISIKDKLQHRSRDSK